MEEREEAAKTLLRKEYAEFSGSQTDICLQCYAVDATKKNLKLNPKITLGCIKRRVACKMHL